MSAHGSSSTFVAISAEPTVSVAGRVDEKLCQHCARPIRLHATLDLPSETVWVCGTEPAVVVHRRPR